MPRSLDRDSTTGVDTYVLITARIMQLRELFCWSKYQTVLCQPPASLQYFVCSNSRAAIQALGEGAVQSNRKFIINTLNLC